MPRPIEIYTRSHCPFCQRAKDLLRIKGVVFVEYLVDAELGRAGELLARSGGSSVPVIFVDDRCIGSCSELFDLDERGDLDRLLTPVRG